MPTPVESVVRDRIGALDAAGLSSLLWRRRIAEAPLPADLDQLARYLVGPASVADAYLQLPLPAIEVLSAVEMCRQLGEPATLGAVAGRLACAAADVARVMDELTELQLAWIDQETNAQESIAQESIAQESIAQESIVTVQRFPIQGRSYGVGIEKCLDAAPIHLLRPMSTKLELRADGAKPEVVERLTAFFSDPAAIAALIDTALPVEQNLLRSAALTDSALYAHPVYLTASSVGSWSVQRGLAWQFANGPVVMPIQVTLAILGEDWALPFHPQRPDVGVGAVSSEHVESEAAARLLRMVELVSNIVDSARSVPIPLLKSGGVGVRTVRNLAKDLHAEAESIQMALELAVSEQLLEEEAPQPTKGRKRQPVSPGVLVPAEAAAQWQASDGGIRGGTLLRSWWESHYFFLAAYTGIADESRAVPPRHLRRALLTAYRSLAPEEGFADRSQMARMLAWTSPCLPVADGEELLELAVREAELLGVLALGAATSLASALVSGDVYSAATTSMSGAHTRATIGADSTAVVFGPPDAALARFFDSVADRESTGAATTWRFDRSSVRRGFDAGLTTQEIVNGLKHYGSDEVPQTLTYLVNDVARTHGSIEIVAVACAVLAEDQALIAEISANRRLAKLGVVALAPTVVGFGAAPDVVTQALRAAGYAPVERDSDGQLVVARSLENADATATSSYPVERRPSFDEIAAGLIDSTTRKNDV